MIVLSSSLFELTEQERQHFVQSISCQDTMTAKNARCKIIPGTATVSADAADFCKRVVVGQTGAASYTALDDEK